MVQTKHLFFLVFVSCFLATFSFYKVDTENSVTQTDSVSRGISSENDATIVSIENSSDTDDESQAEESVRERVFAPHLIQQRNSQRAFSNATRATVDVIENFNSCPRDVDPYQLCRLPKSFIPAELYDKCCRGSQCLRANKECTRSSQCCSGLCVEGVCAADSNNKLFPDEVCTQNTDCHSNICDFKPNSSSVKICYGDRRTNFCSRVSQTCKLNRHCCSNNCSQNRCTGSSLEKAPIGYPCAGDHSECLSNYCNLQTKRCE